MTDEDGNLRKLQKRADDTAAWLAENAPYIPEDQKHLDAGTAEQAYWHYGYVVALRDALKLLRTTDESSKP